MSGPPQTADAAPRASIEPDGSSAADGPLGVQPSPDWVAAERGACPICTREFDDPTEFRDHLGEVHGLYDDDGTETGFGEFAVVVRAEPRAPVIPALAAPRRSQEPPRRGRPLELVAVVVLLLGVLGAMVTFTGRGSDESDTEASAADGAGTGSRRGNEAPGTGSAPTPPAGAPGGGGVSSSTAGRAGTAPPSAHPNPSSATAPPAAGPGPSDVASSSTPAPAPTTTMVPSSSFSAPATYGARIDSCSSARNEQHVTYSWSFSGGARWEPLGAYVALGGGRYQHTVVVHRGKAEITSVFVTDSSGGRHAVSLQPSLSTASC